MKIKALPLVALATMPLTGFAEDMTYFSSLSFGQSSFDVKSESSNNTYNYSKTISSDSQAISGRFGAYATDYRVYGQLDYATAGEDVEQVTYAALTVNADYVYRPHDMVGLFAGPHIGYGYADFDDTREQGGIAPGLQLGSFVHFSNGVELELGYRSTFTQIKTDKGDSGYRPETALNKVAGFYLSAGYAF